MQLELKTDPHRLRSVLRAEPGEYDGLPLFPAIQIAATPINVHPDRAAVAAALLFRHSIAGVFAMQPGCSPLACAAIRSWFAPTDVQVLTVDLTPSRIVSGSAQLHVLAQGVNDGAETSAGGNDVRFRVLSEGASFLATPSEFAVVSNAGLVPDPGDSPLARAIPAVGVAVLFAEDLFANRITLPGIDLETEADRDLSGRLRALLESAALGLSVSERVGA